MIIMKSHSVVVACGVLLDVGWGYARIPPSMSRPGESIWKLHVGSPLTRLDRLTESLDKYILTGAPSNRKTAYEILQEIEAVEEENDEELAIARRRMQRAGFTVDNTRHKVAEQRKQWEESRSKEESASDLLSKKIVLTEPSSSSPTVETLSNSTKALEDELALSSSSPSPMTGDSPAVLSATEIVSELVAKVGASFRGSTMGIGGLDDVLAEIKRRVWIPLAAPPQLLKELGMNPIRGVLLYGKPGCGKTLVAQKLGHVLSPLRPVSIVSGPEIMDKFVGSSEKNLREIFDNPPQVYDFVKNRPNGEAIAKARGGQGRSGDQGDAGVARDSVVNQLLAKMDGAAPLKYPTLVIGLTNKRSLIDAALLRPGRFEVHIEVPPPSTIEQRVSILQVHTKHMHAAGRLHVKDAPVGSPGADYSSICPPEYTYLQLLTKIAKETNGFSGASLAAVARSAASFALERAVEEFSARPSSGDGHNTMLHDCVVTPNDLQKALDDVRNVGETDYHSYETRSVDQDADSILNTDN